MHVTFHSFHSSSSRIVGILDDYTLRLALSVVGSSSSSGSTYIHTTIVKLVVVNYKVFAGNMPLLFCKQALY